MNAPSRITPVTSRQRAKSMSSSGSTARTAALLTRMSMRPKRSRAACTMRATAASSVTSASTARPPGLRARRLRSPRASVFAFTTTAAPAAASASAMARPMLRAAPVTSATFALQLLHPEGREVERSPRAACARTRETARRARAASRHTRSSAGTSPRGRARESGSCAPPRKCGWRSSSSRPSCSRTRTCPVNSSGYGLCGSIS